MKSCSEDIVTLIGAGGLSLVFNTNLFIGKEPTTPINTVTVYDTPGGPPQLTMNKGENYFYDSIQVRVRNADYRTGYALLNSIKTLLHGEGQVTVDSTLYSVIYCTSGPAMLGYDDSGRCLFVANFDIQRR